MQKIKNLIGGLDPHPDLMVLGTFYNDLENYNRLTLYKVYEVKPIESEIIKVHNDILSYSETKHYPIVSEDENGYGKRPTRTFAGLGATVFKIASHYTKLQKELNPHAEKTDILDCQYIVQAFQAGAKYKQIKLDFAQANWLDLRKDVYHRNKLVGYRSSTKCKINHVLYDLIDCDYKTFFESGRFTKSWIAEVKEHFKNIHSNSVSYLMDLIKDYEYFNFRISEVEEKLKLHAMSDAQQLMGIAGIGETIALQLVVILNSLVEDPKKKSSLARYAGIAPIMGSSAHSDEKHCDHRAKGLINHLFHLAARMQIMTKKEGYEYYKKKVGNNKDKKSRELAIRKLKYMIARRVFNTYYR